MWYDAGPGVGRHHDAGATLADGSSGTLKDGAQRKAERSVYGLSHVYPKCPNQRVAGAPIRFCSRSPRRPTAPTTTGGSCGASGRSPALAMEELGENRKRTSLKIKWQKYLVVVFYR